MAARRVRVRGRVQGVYFRASTAECAHRLQLVGNARNEPDGSVLVLAAGTALALDELVEWLHTGPPMARVTSVEVEVIDPALLKWPSEFRTR
ncbi:MAG: acylphosphatase [Steroidobacteraceae bacterium]